jgi:hypothetical protein
MSMKAFKELLLELNSLSDTILPNAPSNTL